MKLPNRGLEETQSAIEGMVSWKKRVKVDEEKLKVKNAGKSCDESNENPRV